jgi:adenylate cyclase
LERKLTAILCADVYGYSRLMGEDEEATHRTLISHRKVIDSLIEQLHGRFVNSAGDSVLAEFASVVNAVQCALEIQSALKAENANIPPERRMEFRIGINLGDVIVDGEQIYGDGVNVAARVEGLAEPGGICISGTVREHLGNKLALNYENLGQQSVKNIAEPVRVFRVLPDSGAATPRRKIHEVVRKYVRPRVFLIAGLAIIAATVMLVQHLSLHPPAPSASIPPPRSTATALPDRPSIVVLPFANMSSDHDQEYFSDGITDDLITSLSRVPNLFVIARTSTVVYKGKPAKVQDISHELGVQYVLEGSVRKAADTVRITAQLVDALSGDHLWTAHYDRPLRDIFALQDEIVQKIVTTLKLRLSVDEYQALVGLGQHTDNLEAYDCYLRCVGNVASITEESNAKGAKMCEKAVALDPGYADAYLALGLHYFGGFAAQWSRYGGPDALDRAIRLEQEAISLDDTNAVAHAILGRLYLSKRQYDKSAAEVERAITLLTPGSALANYWVAFTLSRSGKPADALAYVDKAERLDPHSRALYQFERGVDYVMLERFQDAIAALKEALASYPNNISVHHQLIVAYIELNHPQEARAEAAGVMRISPHFSIEGQKKINAIKDQALAERWYADFRKAGLK